jgi:hypothetical protein
MFSKGVVTNRDAWTYNFSRNRVRDNMMRMINNYNTFLTDYRKGKDPLEKFIRADKTKISWVQNLINDFTKGKVAKFDDSEITTCLYRPFQKMWVYKQRQMIWSPYKTNQIFPENHSNMLINMNGPGAAVDFGAMVSCELTDFNSMAAGTIYARYFYPSASTEATGDQLFDFDIHDTKVDGITDWALRVFRSTYGKGVSKDDIFFYVYGVLSSPEFIKRYKNELKKDSPRVPLLKEFKAYSDFGRSLSELHLKYETIPNDFVQVHISHEVSDAKILYRVEKMRFAKGGDKSVIHFNQFISISNIPDEVYLYLINGKTPVEWVMDRYMVKEDADSGNLNDPNEYSQDPEYVLKLLLSVIAMTKGILDLQKTLPRFVLPEIK